MAAAYKKLRVVVRRRSCKIGDGSRICIREKSVKRFYTRVSELLEAVTMSLVIIIIRAPSFSEIARESKFCARLIKRAMKTFLKKKKLYKLIRKRESYCARRESNWRDRRMKHS